MNNIYKFDKNFNFGNFLIDYINRSDDNDMTACGCATVVQELKDYEFPGGFRFFDCDMVMNDYYIDKVIYNNPATIVFWSDGTKTVSKVHADDTYSPEVGLVLCVLKKLHGSTNVRELLNLWIPDGDSGVVTVSDVRKRGRAKKTQ